MFSSPAVMLKYKVKVSLALHIHDVKIHSERCEVRIKKCSSGVNSDRLRWIGGDGYPQLWVGLLIFEAVYLRRQVELKAPAGSWEVSWACFQIFVVVSNSESGTAIMAGPKFLRSKRTRHFDSTLDSR